MNGKELLEGMSFIDDQYVHEAEQTVLRPWRRWVAVAACICIVFSVVLGWFVWKSKHGEPGPGDLENPTYATAARPTVARPIVIGEAPSVKVRVDRWNENGFEATVTELVDTAVFEIGMRLTVVFADGAMVYGQWVTPTQEMFSVGSVVKVQLQSADGSFDSENQIIYISFIQMSEEE